MLDSTFECSPLEGFEPGDKIRAEVAFDQVDLLDHVEEGETGGNVHFILYKGDHYHLQILTDCGEYLYVDTQDIWDKEDLVGVHIPPEAFTITRRNDD